MASQRVNRRHRRSHSAQLSPIAVKCSQSNSQDSRSQTNTPASEFQRANHTALNTIHPLTKGEYEKNITDSRIESSNEVGHIDILECLKESEQKISSKLIVFEELDIGIVDQSKEKEKKSTEQRDSSWNQGRSLVQPCTSIAQINEQLLSLNQFHSCLLTERIAVKGMRERISAVKLKKLRELSKCMVGKGSGVDFGSLQQTYISTF